MEVEATCLKYIKSFRWMTIQLLPTSPARVPTPPLKSQWGNALGAGPWGPAGFRSTKSVHVFVTLTSSNWLQLLGPGRQRSCVIPFCLCGVCRTTSWCIWARVEVCVCMRAIKAERSWMTVAESRLVLRTRLSFGHIVPLTEGKIMWWLSPLLNLLFCGEMLANLLYRSSNTALMLSSSAVLCSQQSLCFKLFLFLTLLKVSIDLSIYWCFQMEKSRKKTSRGIHNSGFKNETWTGHGTEQVRLANKLEWQKKRLRLHHFPLCQLIHHPLLKLSSELCWTRESVKRGVICLRGGTLSQVQSASSGRDMQACLCVCTLGFHTLT